MSMEVLTILQTSVVFVVYMAMTCVLPFFILNPLLKQFRVCEKLIMSIVFGNFYMINEVLILQLLHISNRYTLILFTLVPACFALSKVYGFSGKAILKSCWEKFLRLIKGELGIKTLAVSAFLNIRGLLARLLKKCLNVIKRNPIDTVLFLALTLLLAHMYGGNLIQHYGYCASDVLVHNYWINYLSRGELFVAGVYPFGFHCVIYFMHAVFGLETYVMLRVFCFIQTLVIHWTLLLFLKACLKSRYLGYLGTAVYAALDIFPASTYSRYYSSLPQEFGMIFILPAVYFGFAFFRHKKEELLRKALDPESSAAPESSAPEREGKALHVLMLPFRRIRIWFSDLSPAKWCLLGFAMSFSLTLAVHFYGTMIAGLFCVAMAVGFSFRFFKRQYFRTVVMTCALSVAIAAFPMVAAYAMGTPLQGSLGWGIEIITGADSKEDAPGETSGEADIPDSEFTSGVTDGIARSVDDPDAGETVGSADTTSGDLTQETQNTGVFQRIGNVLDALRGAVSVYLSKDRNPFVTGSVYCCMAGAVILGILFFALHESDYGAQLLTVGIFILIMNVVLAAGALHLPRLMGGNRCSIYFCYVLPILWCYVVDAVIALALRWFKKPVIGNIFSLLLIGAAVLLTVICDMVRTPYNAGAIEHNGAILCLSNIIYEHDDWSWTICSANDELRMGEDYGYHYETIDLLRRVENIDRHAGVTIPTKYTYFFVEKVPVASYSGYYEGVGQPVSEEGAAEELPRGSRLEPYKGRNRWIVMSRMYYWAETFRKLHPESMTVYYETDDFICYRLVQNVDSLFELGIDYGFNHFYY